MRLSSWQRTHRDNELILNDIWKHFLAGPAATGKFFKGIRLTTNSVPGGGHKPYYQCQICWKPPPQSQSWTQTGCLEDKVNRWPCCQERCGNHTRYAKRNSSPIQRNCTGRVCSRAFICLQGAPRCQNPASQLWIYQSLRGNLEYDALVACACTWELTSGMSWMAVSLCRQVLLPLNVAKAESPQDKGRTHLSRVTFPTWHLTIRFSSWSWMSHASLMSIIPIWRSFERCDSAMVTPGNQWSFASFELVFWMPMLVCLLLSPPAQVLLSLSLSLVGFWHRRWSRAL